MNEFVFWLAGTAVTAFCGGAWSMYKLREAADRREKRRRNRARMYELRRRDAWVQEPRRTAGKPLSAVWFPTRQPLRKAVGLFSDETAQRIVRN